MLYAKSKNARNKDVYVLIKEIETSEWGLYLKDKNAHTLICKSSNAAQNWSAVWTCDNYPSHILKDYEITCVTEYEVDILKLEAL